MKINVLHSSFRPSGPYFRIFGPPIYQDDGHCSTCHNIRYIFTHRPLGPLSSPQFYLCWQKCPVGCLDCLYGKARWYAESSPLFLDVEKEVNDLHRSRLTPSRPTVTTPSQPKKRSSTTIPSSSTLKRHRTCSCFSTYSSLPI